MLINFELRLLINKIYSSVIRDGHTTLVIHVISDNSGYYLIGRGAPTFSIWKYLFSTPASSQCQEIPFSNLFGYGQLMISDTSFFLLTEDAASPYSVHFYRITFSQTSPNWMNKMLWTSGTWTAAISSSVLSSDSSTIHSFFVYGSSSPPPLYYASFSTSTGAVGSSRYKSSVLWASSFRSTLNGDYIVSTAQCYTPSMYYVIIMNIAINSFIIKGFGTQTFLFGWAYDSTGR